MKIEITHKHSNSKMGHPVFLLDGQPVTQAEGLSAALEYLGWTRDDLTMAFGYTNPRSVHRFFLTKEPLKIPANLLNMLAVELEEAQKFKVTKNETK